MSYPTEVTTVIAVAVAIVVVDLVLRLVFRHTLPSGGYRQVGPFRWLRVAVNVAGVVALFLVASTAMSRLMTNENGLTGERLIWHVTTAPLFAVAAVAVAFFWAYRNRFSASDRGHGWALPLRKIFFWIAVALAIPTFASIIAAMFPLTDTEGQQNLIRIHRYCGPLLAAAGFLFAYFALVTWRERRKD